MPYKDNELNRVSEIGEQLEIKKAENYDEIVVGGDPVPDLKVVSYLKNLCWSMCMESPPEICEFFLSGSNIKFEYSKRAFPRSYLFKTSNFDNLIFCSFAEHTMDKCFEL